jgi:hypothetical protein
VVPRRHCRTASRNRTPKTASSGARPGSDHRWNERSDPLHFPRCLLGLLGSWIRARRPPFGGGAVVGRMRRVGRRDGALFGCCGPVVAAQTVGRRRGEERIRGSEATVRTDGRDRIRRLTLRRREGFAAKLAVGVCTRWVNPWHGKLFLFSLRRGQNIFERVYWYSKLRPKVTRPVTKEARSLKSAAQS